MLAKFDFRVQFMEWYIRTKLNTSTEEGQLKNEEMKLHIKKSRAMSKLLIQWVS